MPVVRAADLTFADLPGRRAADPLAHAGVPTGASARVVRIAPGPRTPHVHPLSSEIVYVAAGSGTAWEADVATAVEAGDLVVVPAGVAHATVADGPDDLVLVCFFTNADLPAHLVELDGPQRP